VTIKAKLCYNNRHFYFTSDKHRKRRVKDQTLNFFGLIYLCATAVKMFK